jgi:hypothetical protein
MYHPWRALRELTDWTLHWRPMHGRLGLTNWADRTITLHPDQDQAQRRSTLAHELEHVRRGPVPSAYWHREERAVDKAAARRLITLKAMGEALAWAHNLEEAAEELWVDVDLLRVRLSHLHPAERHYLRRRLEHAEVH